MAGKFGSCPATVIPMPDCSGIASPINYVTVPLKAEWEDDLRPGKPGDRPVLLKFVHLRGKVGTGIFLKIFFLISPIFHRDIGLFF
jgi:hypothetical protein